MKLLRRKTNHYTNFSQFCKLFPDLSYKPITDYPLRNEDCNDKCISKNKKEFS